MLPFPTTTSTTTFEIRFGVLMPFLRPSIKHLQMISDVPKTTDWVVKLLEPLPSPISSLPFFKDRVVSFSMFANSISFPQVQSNVQEVSISGYKIRVPVDTEFSGTINIVFHETVDYEALLALWEWQKAIESPNTKVKKEKYKAKMAIYPHKPIAKQGPNYPLPRNERVRVQAPIAYILYGVAISGLTLPDFTGDKNGEVVRPTATFSFDWMNIVKEPLNIELSF